MGIKAWFSKLNEWSAPGISTEMDVVDKTAHIMPEANVFAPSNGVQGAPGYVYAIYDGEKNLGEMGPPKAYIKDFYTLRIRSKQLYLESDICQTVINRFTAWVIGPGLGLKSEPQKEILKNKKIAIDTEVFNKTQEGLWKLYSNSRMASYNGQHNLNGLQEESHREGKLGGDILVILRVVGLIVKVQHVDAINLGNPPNCTIKYNDKSTIGTTDFTGYDYVFNETGNRIRLGVEIDDSGAHVAYHIRVGYGLEYERIKCRDRNGMLRAYLYYGFKPGIEEARGTPLLSVVMETAKKLERYNSAALAGAEERAKLAYFFVHGVASDGEDPLAPRRAKASIGRVTIDDSVNTDIGVDVFGNKIAQEVAATTNKTVINMPVGADVKMPDSRQEVHVAEFSMMQIDLICAAVNIPPNVAMSKYEDSFSASRMAGKDWEHTFMTEREDFSQQYLNPIYELQTYIWALANEVNMPGYLDAMKQKNMIVTSAYMYCRWVGDSFPDIDPLKTIKYVREAMGIGMEQVPLMTPERGAEIIGEGGIADIIRQSGEELQLTKDAGIELPEEDEIAPDIMDDPKEGKARRVNKKTTK